MAKSYRSYPDAGRFSEGAESVAYAFAGVAARAWADTNARFEADARDAAVYRAASARLQAAGRCGGRRGIEAPEEAGHHSAAPPSHRGEGPERGGEGRRRGGAWGQSSRGRGSRARPRPGEARRRSSRQRFASAEREGAFLHRRCRRRQNACFVWVTEPPN